MHFEQRAFFVFLFELKMAASIQHQLFWTLVNIHALNVTSYTLSHLFKTNKTQNAFTYNLKYASCK